MTQQPPFEATAASGAIEFEITDIASARHALDELPQFTTLAPGYWEQRRRKLLPRDRALVGATMDWLFALPPSLRPHALCERYPRVANDVAAAWPQAAGRLRLFDALLTDSRGQRRGFALDVRAEIEALRRALATDISI